MLNSCHKVVENADQLLDGTLLWRQRLSLRLHLLICNTCRRYLRQLRALLRAIPFMHGEASDEEVQRVMEHIQTHPDQQP